MIHSPDKYPMFNDLYCQELPESGTFWYVMEGSDDYRFKHATSDDLLGFLEGDVLATSILNEVIEKSAAISNRFSIPSEDKFFFGQDVGIVVCSGTEVCFVPSSNWETPHSG
eukprot:1410051-Rhodomonas_salina.4